MRRPRGALPRRGHPRDRRGLTRTRLWPGSARTRVAPHRLQSLRPPVRRPRLAGVLLRRLDGPAARCRSSASAPCCSSRARPAATASPVPWPARSPWSARLRPACGPAPWTGAGRARPAAGRYGVTSSSATAFVAAVVLGGPQWTLVRAGRARPEAAAPTSARWCAPGGRTRSTPSGRQTAFALGVGGRRGRLRRRAAAGHAARHADQSAGGLHDRRGDRLRRWPVAGRPAATRSRRCTRWSRGGPPARRSCSARPCSVVAVVYLAVGARLRRHGRRRRGLRRRRGRARAVRGGAGRLRRRQPRRGPGVRRRSGCPARSPRGSSAARCSSASPRSCCSPSARCRVLVVVGLRRRAVHRAGAGLGHVAGRVAGAALGVSPRR